MTAFTVRDLWVVVGSLSEHAPRGDWGCYPTREAAMIRREELLGMFAFAQIDMPHRVRAHTHADIDCSCWIPWKDAVA